MVEPSEKTVAALEAAVAAVKAAKVPKDLRVAAFNAAFYGSEVGASNTPESPRTPKSPSGTQSQSAGTIATKLGVDGDLVDQVFDLDEDGVHLTIQRGRLSDQKKVAQQEIARLLVAGRQAAGIEEWTAIGLVTQAVHDRGVHDANFSRNVGALDGDGIRFRGSKTKRELKMNQVGFEKAAEVVRRIAESGQ